MRSDDPRRPARHGRAASRWWRALLLLAALAGAGCAGMPPPPPPTPAGLPDDSYSGGSNFGGRPMYLGPQT